MILVDQMILEIGVVNDPERVGFYSGLLESIFACMSFICSKTFSRMSLLHLLVNN